MKSFLGFMVLFFAITGLAVEDFKVCSGQAAFLNIFFKLNTAMEKKINIKAVPALDINTAGSMESFDGLAQGKCEAIIAPSDFNQYVKLINGTGRKMDAKEFTFQVLGKDLIKIAVHPGLKISQITKAQLTAIYTGKVKNWKELGGDDLKIIIFTFKTKLATHTSFKSQILKDSDFTTDVKDVTSWDDLNATMEKVPGSITFMAENVESKGLKLLKTDEDIGRPITMITKGKPSERAQKVAEYIRGEGKALLK